MLRILILSLSILSLGACAQSNGGTNLDVKQVSEMMENEDIVVVDVRTPQEYNQGHLKGAQLVDFYGANFKEEIGKLDKAKKYVVYCRSGGRSAKSVQMMKEMGFTDVYNMSGGFISWSSANLESTK